MLYFKLFLLTWALAIVAYIYTIVLTDTGMLLAWWRHFWLMRFRKRGGEDNPLFKIIVGCEYCVAGQWALWAYVYLSIFKPEPFDLITYSIWDHIALVAFTIFNMVLLIKYEPYGTK